MQQRQRWKTSSQHQHGLQVQRHPWKKSSRHLTGMARKGGLPQQQQHPRQSRRLRQLRDPLSSHLLRLRRRLQSQLLQQFRLCMMQCTMQSSQLLRVRLGMMRLKLLSIRLCRMQSQLIHLRLCMVQLQCCGNVAARFTPRQLLTLHLPWQMAIATVSTELLGRLGDGQTTTTRASPWSSRCRWIRMVQTRHR